MTEVAGEVNDLVNTVGAQPLSSVFESVSTDGAFVVDLANKASSRVPYFMSTGRSGDGIDDVFAFVLDEGQELTEVDLRKYLPDLPRVASGHATARTAASFMTYVERHIHPERTTFWADADLAEILAIFDDQPIGPSGDKMDDEVGRARHRATLKMRHTSDWKAWIGKDDKLMSQEAFAEFLEDNAGLITAPPAATFIEIARTFTARKGVNFKSSYHTESGAVGFEYEETIAARTGQRGNVEIPGDFMISIQPFEGSDFYPLGARFKYRLTDKGLELGYRLIRPDVIRDAVFELAVSQIAGALDVTIMSASPGR